MKKRGFTLIELLIVLSIISTFIGLIVLKSGIVTKMKEKSEAKTLLADMNYCREKSLTTGYDYRIESFGNMYEIIEENHTLNKKQVELSYLKSKKSYTIRFTPTGVVINANTLIFTSNNNTYEYIISPIAGRIRMNE